MPTVKFIGRTSYNRGKRLFDILARLKGFGVGRIVYRNAFLERYAEPSYFVITKVNPDMTDLTEAEIDARNKSIAYGMKVWRGQQWGEGTIKAGYKNDWRLVPKLDEAKFLSYKATDRALTIVPDKIPMPPLLEYLVLEERRRDSGQKSAPLSELERPMMRVRIRDDARTAVMASEMKLLTDP